MIEGRQLPGQNIHPVVRVSVSNQVRQTRVKKSTNKPYYNEVSILFNPQQILFAQNYLVFFTVSMLNLQDKGKHRKFLINLHQIKLNDHVCNVKFMSSFTDFLFQFSNGAL